MKPGMKLAVSGKGGVGKTTLAALMGEELARRGRKVLLIDADPTASLAFALGLPPAEADAIVPITEMADLIEERTGVKPGTYGGMFRMNPRVDDIPDQFARTVDGIRLLVTGSMKDAAAGCYCPENQLLKMLLHHVIVQRDEVVIVDMEAGIEHLSRGTTQAVDGMVIVVEPGYRSIRTGMTIERMATRLGIPRVMYVVNKVVDADDLRFVEKELGERPLLGYLSFSRAVALADREGERTASASPATVEEVAGIVDGLAVAFQAGQ